MDMSTDAHKKRLIFLAILIAALAFLALDMVRPFFRPLILASVICIGCYPLHHFLLRRIRRKEWAALLTTLIVFVGVALPAFLLTYMLSAELLHAAADIRDQSSREGGFFAYAQHGQERLVTWMGQYVDVDQLRVRQRVGALPEQASGFLLGLGSSMAGSALNGVADGILTFVFLFFFFRDGSGWLEGLARTLPLPPQNVQRMYKAVHSSVVATLYGLVGVALAQGLLTGLGLYIAGIEIGRAHV